MRRRLSRFDVLLLLLFAAPIPASISGGAAVAKLAFPLAAALLALWWAERDPARYVRLLLWTFIVAPGLRHFVELYSGYSQTDPIMLAPYFVVAAASSRVLRYLLAGRRYVTRFLLLIAVILYGLAVGLGVGSVTEALIEAMRWLAPLWVALFICARAESLPQIRDATHRTLRVAIPLIAIYGIAQFIDVTPWDAYFMKMSWKEASFNSIGVPKPFEVRVFATMNSPGSLAGMLGTGILLLLPITRRRGWILVLLGIACLFLTDQRAAWGAFGVGLLAMLAVSRDRTMRRRIAKAAAAIMVVYVILIGVPGFAAWVEERAQSIAYLSHDKSADARWNEYEAMLAQLNVSLLGRGLGPRADSGFIEIFVNLGIPCGALFTIGLLALAFEGRRICRPQRDSNAAAEFAAAIFGLTQLPFGPQFAAETGVFLYLSLGLLLARANAGYCRPANSCEEIAAGEEADPLATILSKNSAAVREFE